MLGRSEMSSRAASVVASLAPLTLLEDLCERQATCAGQSDIKPTFGHDKLCMNVCEVKLTESIN